MPLVKRLIEPVYIGRGALDKQVKNELEGVTINSLAGVIKQLSSISKHAEDLFGELINEAGAIYQRSAALGQRVQTLYERTTQLDSAVKEDVKVEEFSVMTHFKSRRQEEQQVLTPNTLPQALKEVYSSCDQPPKLNKFTPYRDDSKDGIKFYTDRNYFYDLWVQQQYQLLKDRKKKGDKRRRRKRRENNPTKKIQGVKKKRYAAVDAEFVTADTNREPDRVTSAPMTSAPASVPPPPSAQESRPAGGPPPPPAPPSQAQLAAPTAPPPPPPPALMNTGVPPPPPPMAASPSIPHATVASPYAVPPPPPPVMAMQGGGPPAPPPPPPPMGMAAPPPPPLAPMGLPPPPPPPGPAPPVMAAPPVVRTPEPDPRQDLLTAIEMGKKLRKVERSDEVKKQEYGSDVASILARRIVMEVSDTDSDSGSDYSGSWSD